MQKDIEKALDEIFNNNKPIDAIIFSTNTISLIALKNIINRGLKIAKDIQVVCFDKSEVYNFMQGSVTYIQQPIKELGEKAVDILLSHIESKSKEVITLKLDAQLINS